MVKIIQIGHPVLTQIAEEVPFEDITSASVKKVLRDMRSALSKRSDGVAIAAPQIGVPLRIFIVSDASIPEEERPGLPDLVCINPTLIKISQKKKEEEEGCLSVDGRFGMVKRATRATVRAYDEKGKLFERGASGLLAQIFQHETDHLDGILFTDRAKRLYPVEQVAEGTAGGQRIKTA